MQQMKRIRIITLGDEQEEAKVTLLEKESDWQALEDEMLTKANELEAEGSAYIISYEGYTPQGRHRQSQLSWSPREEWQK